MRQDDYNIHSKYQRKEIHTIVERLASNKRKCEWAVKEKERVAKGKHLLAINWNDVVAMQKRVHILVVGIC